MTFSDSVLKRGSKGPPEQKETHFPIPGGSLLGAFWLQMFKMELFKEMFSVFLSDSKKVVKMELPKGGDMQSDNACACFVRVGRCRFGSILGSILESFWEPSSLLYSFLVARVAKTGAQKRG